jgi:hypothetical protein
MAGIDGPGSFAAAVDDAIADENRRYVEDVAALTPAEIEAGALFQNSHPSWVGLVSMPVEQVALMVKAGVLVNRHDELTDCFYVGMRLDHRQASGAVVVDGKLRGVVIRYYKGLPADGNYRWRAIRMGDGYALEESPYVALPCVKLGTPLTNHDDRDMGLPTLDDAIDAVLGKEGA